MYKLGNNILTLNDKLIIPTYNYPTDGLVARWAFEGNLNDSFHNYNLSSNSGVTYQQGKIRQCANQVKNQAYYIVNSTILSGLTGINHYTIGGWYLYKDKNGNNNNASCGLKVTGTYDASHWQTIGFGFRQNIEMAMNIVHRDKVVDVVDVTGIVGIRGFQKNTWYHIMQTFDGNYTKTYLQAQLLDTQTNSYSLESIYYDGYCVIDKYNENEGIYGIDNHYLYNRALTLAEIQVLFNEI